MLDLSLSSDIFMISGGECAASGAPFIGGIFLEYRVLSKLQFLKLQFVPILAIYRFW